MQDERHLIIIPIIHTLADWGSLGSRKVFDEEIEALKTQYWRDVFEYVQKLSVDFSELRVYQDGLRDISAEEVGWQYLLIESQKSIIDFFAGLGSRAHILWEQKVGLFYYKNNVPYKLF